MSRGYRDEDEKVGVDVGEAEVIRDSGKALLCRLHDHNGREIWVPTSQICEDSEVYKVGTEGVLIVTEWFAKKEKLV